MKMVKLYPVTENVTTLPTTRRAGMDEEDLTKSAEVWRQRDGVEIEAGTRVPRKNSRKIRTVRSSAKLDPLSLDQMK